MAHEVHFFYFCQKEQWIGYFKILYQKILCYTCIELHKTTFDNLQIKKSWLKVGGEQGRQQKYTTRIGGKNKLQQQQHNNNSKTLKHAANLVLYSHDCKSTFPFWIKPVLMIKQFLWHRKYLP